MFNIFNGFTCLGAQSSNVELKIPLVKIQIYVYNEI